MTPIWFAQTIPSLDALREHGKNRPPNMIQHLGIELTAIDDDSLTGTMPVDHRTHQPMGLLHGGASMVLAETLGSIAGNLVVDSQRLYCVGLEINGNHIRSCTSGVVTGRATPIHLGSKTQVWEIRLHQDPHLVCISRITLAVLERKPKS